MIVCAFRMVVVLVARENALVVTIRHLGLDLALLSLLCFFQAEDGIRDYKVTGVQTCALPIYGPAASDQRTHRTIPGCRRVGGALRHDLAVRQAESRKSFQRCQHCHHASAARRSRQVLSSSSLGKIRAFTPWRVSSLKHTSTPTSASFAPRTLTSVCSSASLESTVFPYISES